MKNVMTPNSTLTIVLVAAMAAVALRAAVGGQSRGGRPAPGPRRLR